MLTTLLPFAFLGFVALQEPKVTTPEEGLARLKAGNVRSLRPNDTPPIVNQPNRNKLAAGQEPYAVILGCSDSRVPPEIVFDEPAGELFVVRVAGNVVDAPTLGSVEYGVEHLHAKVVVVMGHESCGAVKAALMPAAEQQKLTTNIRFLLDRIETGDPKGPEDHTKKATLANIRYQLGLLASEPLIKDEIAHHKLVIVGAYYDISTGKVEFLK